MKTIVDERFRILKYGVKVNNEQRAIEQGEEQG
jgi:hypothetical protein